MKKLVGISFLLLCAWALTLVAAENKTYTGAISDKMCGAKHMMEGGDAKCTLACVDKGSSFVFVQGEKVIDIENQDAKGLRDAAGKKVTVLGAMSKDGKSIKIAEIKKPAK